MDAPAPRRADYRPADPTFTSWDVQRRSDVRSPRREPGLTGWLALLVLLLIAGIGGAIDVTSGSAVRGGFNIGLVVASIVAILVVRRRDMLTIVVAPPLVYAAASITLLYVRSGGLSNRKILLDAAVNWLVYGFPAMAAATGAVLLIAGVRLIRGRGDGRSAAESVPPAGPQDSYAGQPPAYPRSVADSGEPVDPNRVRWRG